MGLYDQENSGDQQFYGFNGNGWTLTTTDTILSDTVTTGFEYTLSGLWWGGRSDRRAALTAKLLAIDGSGNETVLATDTWLSDGNVGTEWDSKAEARTFTLSVTPTTNAGERLAIYLNDGGLGTKHTMIDDVSLAVVVPELTWDGGDGTWTAANWDTGSSWVNNALVTFETSGAQTITIPDGASPSTSGMTFNSGGPYTIAASGSGELNLNGDIATAGGVTATISAPLNLGANVEKTGSGTLAVNGAVTALANETLTISGGTLAGNGTIPDLVIGSGGTLAPGNSIGEIAVENTATWADGSTYDWEFASPTEADLVDVSAGTLTLPSSPGTVTLNIIPFGTPVVYADDVFTLFTYGALDGVAEGTITSTFSINYLGDSNKWITRAAAITASDGVISLTGIEYIPEPASLALLGIGALLIAGRRRRG